MRRLNAVVFGVGRSVGAVVHGVWHAGAEVAHGIRVEFSHVVYFILIERFLHHFVLSVDWHEQGRVVVTALFAVLVSQ